MGQGQRDIEHSPRLLAFRHLRYCRGRYLRRHYFVSFSVKRQRCLPIICNQILCHGLPPAAGAFCCLTVNDASIRRIRRSYPNCRPRMGRRIKIVPQFSGNVRFFRCPCLNRFVYVHRSHLQSRLWDMLYGILYMLR